MGPRYRLTCTRAGFTRLDNETVINAYRRSKNRLILLDIGGTLLTQVKVDNIHMYANASSKEGATHRRVITTSAKKNNINTTATTKHRSKFLPSSSAMNALKKLSNDTVNNTVFLISGQDNDSIAPLFESIENLGIVCDSGFTYRWSKTTKFQTMDAHFNLSWMDTAGEIMQVYTRRTTGSYIENKKFARLWRYSDADPDYGPLQAREMVDHLNNVLANFPVIVIKGKGYVEVRPEGVDKGSVIKRILSFMGEQEDHKERPVDFILCVGDDVADEAVFRELSSYQGATNGENRMGHGLRAHMLANSHGGDSGCGGDSGGVGGGGSGISGSYQSSDMSSYDLWRQQYRSFRKGAAKGAHGEVSKLPVRLSLPVKLPMKANATATATATNTTTTNTTTANTNHNTSNNNTSKTSTSGTTSTLITPLTADDRISKHQSLPNSATTSLVRQELSMFTVTVGRKPSDASYYYDSHEDVVELLSSLAKCGGFHGRMGMKRTPSGSEKPMSSPQRSASLSDLSSLMYRADDIERSSFFWNAERTLIQKTTKTTIAQRRERSAFQRETQQARLKGRLTESTSLSNLAKLVEGGEVLNEETVASAQAASANPVSAAYQTMEQYMDFQEEEAPGF